MTGPDAPLDSDRQLLQRDRRLEVLKQRAGVAVASAPTGNCPNALTPVDVTKVLEELRVYQAELEVQNDELQQSQRELELSRARYQTLFRQLPLPALVIDGKGLIEDCNLKASALLGTAMAYVAQDNRLVHALSADDRARLYRAIRDTMDGQLQVMEKVPIEDPQRKIGVFDVHLIRLTRAYHLDTRLMALLVDRSADLARAEDRHFFSIFLDSSEDFVCSADTTGRIQMANRAMLEYLGRKRDDVIGHTRSDFLPLRDALAHQQADQHVLRTGEPVALEEHMQAGIGSRSLDLLTRKFALFDLNDNITGVGAISTDITDLKAQQRQALLSEMVFMAAADSVCITDPHTRIVRVNPAFTALSGLSESSVLGLKTNILKSGRHDDAFYKAMWEVLNKRDHWAGEMSNRAADGHVYTVWNSINAIRDSQDKLIYYVAIQTDLTPLREAQSKIEKLASYDSLTGLPNRTLFNDRLRQLLAHARRNRTSFALLFVDLDHFKEVNDSLGHQVGDDLLQTIAARLQSALRADDTVSRMGGDEFVILLPATDREQAHALANKLLELLRAPLQLGSMADYQPMASLGIAVYPDDGATPDLLLRNADTAMYNAKEAGRNRSAIYEPQMSEVSARAFSIQTDLVAGIERQELRLHYQAKVDLRTGAMVGAEALVRWQRPLHGLLGPAEFIATAEKTGTVVAIDKWVLNEALRQISEWTTAGLWAPQWRLAVNQNAADLRRKSMLDELKHLLRMHKVDAQALEMEITEGALLEHTQEMIERLNELRALGISLSIDDFGTGFSSLSYLRKLPISTIKIDQSFVRDMLVNENDRVLVQTIVAMAHNLGHALVAEGIENLQQQIKLAELGCETGQGYLLGRPLPADEFRRVFLDPTASRAK